MRSLETQYSPDDPDAVRSDLLTKLALQRYGTNEEVAQLALFLASDESSYCSCFKSAGPGAYAQALR